MSPSDLKRAHETACAFDEERGYPWPYETRPCFGCGDVALQVVEGFAFCDPCALEERKSAEPERVGHMREHDEEVAAHKRDLKSELQRNRDEESRSRKRHTLSN